MDCIRPFIAALDRRLPLISSFYKVTGSELLRHQVFIEEGLEE